MISSFTNVLLRVVNAIRITFSLIFKLTVKFLNIQPRFNKTYFYFRQSEPVSQGICCLITRPRSTEKLNTEVVQSIAYMTMQIKIPLPVEAVSMTTGSGCRSLSGWLENCFSSLDSSSQSLICLSSPKSSRWAVVVLPKRSISSKSSPYQLPSEPASGFTDIIERSSVCDAFQRDAATDARKAGKTVLNSSDQTLCNYEKWFGQAERSDRGSRC